MTKPIEDSTNAAAIRAALDVPTTGALNTVGAVAQAAAETAAAKYTKPSTGITASDLASAAQTSLGKADSAIQDLAGMTAKFNAGTAPEKAAFQSSVSGYTPIAYTTMIPLTGSAMMPQQTVGAAITFTAAANPALMGTCRVRLIANGVNVPNFAAWAEYGSSGGWNNTSGIINHVDFWWDGVTYWYAVQQAANALPVTVPTVSSATIGSSTPTQITLVFSATLSGASVPAAGSFVITNSGGADTCTAVAVSGTTVTLTKSRTTLSGDVVTLAYTAPGSGYLVSPDGIAVGNFSGKAVSNQLASQNIRLATLGSFAESGDATAGYTYTATNGNLGTTLATNASHGIDADGYVQVKVAVTVAATGVFFLDDANDTANYAGSILGIQTNGAGSAYLIVRNGGANNAANGTAVLAAVNDMIRIERAGTIGYVRVSKDNGSTWTLLHTLTGVPTTKLYPKLNGGPTTAQWGPITGFGVS